MELSPKKTPLAATGTLLVATGALVLRAAVGRELLDSMNDADVPVLGALKSHADPGGFAGAAHGGEPDRLVVAVLDGLGEAGFSRALEHAGLTDWQWRATVDMGTPSLSRPVYHVLLTGAPQSVSGIGNNGHRGPARADDLAARVREAGGTVGWALEGVTWFHDLFGQPEDIYENAWPQRAPGLNVAMDRFRPMGEVLDRNPTLAVLHFVGIDHAGHARGAASEEYRRAAAEAVDAVLALRGAHAASPAGARTVWMIGSDHGHRARGGHGGPEPEVVRTTWLGLWPSATRAGAARMEPVEIPGVVAAASALLPAAAYAIAAGSMGRSRLPDVALLLFPTTGLVPLGVVAGTLVACGVAALFDRRRRSREPRSSPSARDAAEAHSPDAGW